jgi:hypothetical protein
MFHRKRTYLLQPVPAVLLVCYLLLFCVQMSGRFYAAANLVRPGQLAQIIGANTGNVRNMLPQVKNDQHPLHLRLDKRYNQQPSVAGMPAAVQVPRPAYVYLPPAKLSSFVFLVTRFASHSAGLRGPPFVAQ